MQLLASRTFFLREVFVEMGRRGTKVYFKPVLFHFPVPFDKTFV